MGRPPIGKRAMTNAERQKRYRQQHPEKQSGIALMRARIQELEAALKAAKRRNKKEQ